MKEMKYYPILPLIFAVIGIYNNFYYPSHSTPYSIDCIKTAPQINFPSLLTMSEHELRIARNSIYAKHGKVFESADLKEYFQRQLWYTENPFFTPDLLSERDINAIHLISCLEEKEYILWAKIANFDHKEGNELCLVVEKKDRSGAFLFINDYKTSFLNNWSDHEAVFNEESLSPYWSNLTVELIDLNQLDNQKEIWIGQNYLETEDPSIENQIFWITNNAIQSNTLESWGYNSGEIKIYSNYLVLVVDDCPYHTRTFIMKKGSLIMESEFIGKEPQKGCPG